MDIEIQNRKQEATFKNGKYQYTFTPTNATEKIKLYHMGCVGDTRLTHLQLEKGNEVTPFVAPKETANSLSGIFKNLRDLDVQLRDTNSEFWGRLKLNNKGMLTEFFNKEVKTAIASAAEGVSTSVSNALNTQVASINQRVNEIRSSVNTLDGNALKKNEVKITADGVEIGAGKKIDGNTISSMLITKPESITAISKKFRVTGDMIVAGTIEGKHLKSATIETGHFQAGSVTANIIASDAITADKMKVDQAVIDKLLTNDLLVTKLFAKDAFIKNLKTVKISATQITSDALEAYVGKIGNFRLGQHWGGSGQWITGANNFSVGMSDGSWDRTALWVNWGNKWSSPGNTAWFVKPNGKMYCYNQAEFWNTPIIHGDLWVSGQIFYKNTETGKGGYWTYSPQYQKIANDKGYVYFYYSGGGYDWIPVNKEISDRRYKTNIKDSEVKGLEVIEKLKTYSYTKNYDGKQTEIECGIMAQDVKEYAKDAFKEAPGGVYTYNTFELVPYMIKAIQELKQEIEVLKYAG